MRGRRVGLFGISCRILQQTHRSLCHSMPLFPFFSLFSFFFEAHTCLIDKGLFGVLVICGLNFVSQG